MEVPTSHTESIVGFQTLSVVDTLDCQSQQINLTIWEDLGLGCYS